MRTRSEMVEGKRRVLEAEFGFPFLAVLDAATMLGLTAMAIYKTPEKYQLTRYDGSVFVPAPVVDQIIGERMVERYMEIRGVEYEGGVGRMDVVRHLCIPCRRFYRSWDGFKGHDCKVVAKG